MKIKIPKGFLVGEAENDFTGITVIVAPNGATAGADVRGGAPGTRETDLLRSEKMMKKINAVALCGGSAYGLGAVQGVMKSLRKRGVGYKTGGKLVPIVPAAVIYDLNAKEYHFPTPEMGYSATENAFLSKPRFGQFGVGKGATVGKIRGAKYAGKGGVGAASVTSCGITVTAVVAVNAMGDVFDHKTGEQLSGAKLNDGTFLNTEQCILNGEWKKLVFGSNTTIGCILTDAKLTKAEANQLASVAQDGLAKTIRPVHTDFDGDSLFVLSTGKKRALNLLIVQVAAVEAAALAVENAVRSGDGIEIVSDEDEAADVSPFPFCADAPTDTDTEFTKETADTAKD